MMKTRDEITGNRDPTRLKSFLIISVAAFVVYSAYVAMFGYVYLQYDNQWWFERDIDWSRDAIGVFFQILPPNMLVVVIPSIAGIYGGYHFLVMRRQILDRTLKKAPRNITIGVALLWIPWIVLYGGLLLHPTIMSVWSPNFSASQAIQNFIYVPLFSLGTINLPGLLSLYVYRMRKKYKQGY